MTNDKDTVERVASIIGGMLYNEILPYFRVDPDLFLGDVEAGEIALSASREVLSALHPTIEAAVLKERERCARIADSQAQEFRHCTQNYENGREDAGLSIAAAIREDAK